MAATSEPDCRTGPPSASAIYRAYARSDRAMEHAVEYRQPIGDSRGWTAGGFDGRGMTMSGVSGFTHHYPQLGAQGFASGVPRALDPAQPHTGKGSGCTGLHDRSDRLSEA